MWSRNVYRQTYRPPYEVPSKQALLSTTLVSNERITLFYISNGKYYVHLPFILSLH